MKTEITAETLFERRKKAVANGIGIFNHATVKHAKGAIITEIDGREVIDFAGGIGVVNAGHSPEPVVKAIQEQAEKYLHTSFNVVSYEPYVELCEKLTEILPHGENTKSMLVSTGAEAVENAIKIARQATKRGAVISFSDAYHGRTMMAMTLTGKTSYKVGCGPFAPEVYRIPFPNFYRYGNGRTESEFAKDELIELNKIQYNLVDPNIISAVIVEPIQGEGGFNPMPKEYLVGLREFCDKYGIMLILDEVQSGFGRTGHWASWQHYKVTPDISTYAKSMGSGLPIAAVVGKADIMDSAAIGSIGGTYIGSPIACAAANATIKYMEDLNLNQRAIEVGNTILKRLNKLKTECSAIGDVRGVGAMTAIEFVFDGNPKNPNMDICKKIVAACYKEGLVVISAGTYKNVIRILSPLVITDEELDRGLNILETQIKNITNN